MFVNAEPSEVPVFPVPRGVPLFSGEDIAGMCSFGDLKFDEAKRLLDDFRRKGLVLPGKVGAHRKFFYPPVEAAIFKLATEVHDFGVCDAGLQAAALACRAWSPDNPAAGVGVGSPIWAAMVGCWHGEHWGLALTCWRSDQGGPRHFAAFCHTLKVRNPLPSYLTDDYQPHVMTSVVLHRILNPLHSRMLTLLKSRGQVPADRA